jgi:hypothetical protein
MLVDALLVLLLLVLAAGGVWFVVGALKGGRRAGS